MNYSINKQTEKLVNRLIQKKEELNLEVFEGPMNSKIIDAGVNTNVFAGNDINAVADKELFINGGNAVGIHCETDVIQTTSGRDLEDAPDFYNKFSSFYDPDDESNFDTSAKILRFNDPEGYLD